VLIVGDQEDVRLGALGTVRNQFYFPRTTSMPVKSSSSLARGSLPTHSVRRSLSRVTICETLATEFFGSPVRRAGSETFPGAVAQRRLLVSGTHTTVAILLRFKASP
jgi:hypothetical protein